MNTIKECFAVPDDDPRLCGAQEGMTKLTDGVLYVRESDWLAFLTEVIRVCLGNEEADRFWKSVIH